MSHRNYERVYLQMKKQPRQKKSRMYYYFWSIMTATVLLGQIYVGTGYRVMAEAVLNMIENGLMVSVE